MKKLLLLLLSWKRVVFAEPYFQAGLRGLPGFNPLRSGSGWDCVQVTIIGMFRPMRMLLTAIVLVFAGLNSFGGTENWPQFRGPTGDGHVDTKGLPVTWSETNHVAWKTAIHGKAWSSPVILGSQVWVTTATEDGRQLFAVCVDRQTGKILRDLKVFEVEKPQFCHQFNSYASPTPVIEEGKVYVTFGAPGTACLDTETGRVLWERRDFECNHYRSAGSSPILYQNLLILHFDGSDQQYVAALDKRTGQTVWRVNRSIDFKDLGPDGKPQTEGDLRKGFSTPHVALLDGQPTLLSLGAKAAYAYEPLTGKELWRVEERQNHSASTRPLIGHGLVFAPSGFSSGQLLAIRPGKPGEVIDCERGGAWIVHPKGGVEIQTQCAQEAFAAVGR